MSTPHFCSYIKVLRERPFSNPVLSKRVMNEKLWAFLLLIHKFRSRAYRPSILCLRIRLTLDLKEHPNPFYPAIALSSWISMDDQPTTFHVWIKPETKFIFSQTTGMMTYFAQNTFSILLILTPVDLENTAYCTVGGICLGCLVILPNHTSRNKSYL